ncbi:hypothetical protein C8R45DRAFT_1179229 [Mycena sanguinolenta]|nr:hypothetical protein C8R45DRAFT_1179229 [Mycena sanguinolenta]
MIAKIAKLLIDFLACKHLAVKGDRMSNLCSNSMDRLLLNFFGFMVYCKQLPAGMRDEIGNEMCGGFYGNTDNWARQPNESADFMPIAMSKGRRRPKAAHPLYSVKPPIGDMSASWQSVDKRQNVDKGRGQRLLTGLYDKGALSLLKRPVTYSCRKLAVGTSCQKCVLTAKLPPESKENPKLANCLMEYSVAQSPCFAEPTGGARWIESCKQCTLTPAPTPNATQTSLPRRLIGAYNGGRLFWKFGYHQVHSQTLRMCNAFSTSIILGAISLIPYNRYILWTLGLASLVLYGADHQRPSKKFGTLEATINSVGETLKLANTTCTRSYVELMDMTTKFYEVKLSASNIKSRLLETHTVSTWKELKEYIRNSKEMWQSTYRCAKRVEEIRTSIERVIEVENQRELLEGIRTSREIMSSLMLDLKVGIVTVNRRIESAVTKSHQSGSMTDAERPRAEDACRGD